VAYYLGIDGGGSKTTCMLGDDTSLLATATTGPSNITRVGEERARESMHSAIHQACAAAKVAPQQIQRSCIGAAGAGREEIAGVVRRIVAEVIPQGVEVVGDMQIALQAAFGAGPGVIVIAGTGSIAYGRNAQGRTARAGGWGFAISDEGSAHWIGRRAVAALLRAADSNSVEQNLVDPNSGKQSSPALSGLWREIQAAWNLDSLEKLARAANSNPDFAALLPAVVAAAGAGNDLAQQVLAQQVLTQAAEELARLADLVLRRLFPEQATGSAVSMAMAGGVFCHVPMVRERFSNLVRTAHSQVALNDEVVEPVHGALQMARRFSLQTQQS
jgi:glucosamine kinase